MQVTYEQLDEIALGSNIVIADESNRKNILEIAAGFIMNDPGVNDGNLIGAAQHYISEAILFAANSVETTQGTKQNQQQTAPAQQQQTAPAQQQQQQEPLTHQNRVLKTFRDFLVAESSNCKKFEDKLKLLNHLLPAESISFRIGSARNLANGYSLLAYKDARVDMEILDAIFGRDGWTSEYERDSYQQTKILTLGGKLVNSLGYNDKFHSLQTFQKSTLVCSIGIYNDEGDIVYKRYNGSESNTEEEKGQYSDAFKRAGVMWGIGRKLYDMPFIWIKNMGEKDKKDINLNRWKAIFKDDGENYTHITLKDEKGRTRFTWNG